MSAKGKGKIIDERLEETMGLFQPTAQQEAAARVVEANSELPAPPSQGASKRPENRVFGYRVGPELNEMLIRAVEEYLADGWQTTLSDVLRAWAMAGRELWKAGQVEVDGKAVRSGARKRKG